VTRIAAHGKSSRKRHAACCVTSKLSLLHAINDTSRQQRVEPWRGGSKSEYDLPWALSMHWVGCREQQAEMQLNHMHALATRLHTSLQRLACLDSLSDRHTIVGNRVVFTGFNVSPQPFHRLHIDTPHILLLSHIAPPAHSLLFHTHHYPPSTLLPPHPRPIRTRKTNHTHPNMAGSGKLSWDTVEVWQKLVAAIIASGVKVSSPLLLLMKSLNH